SAIRRLGFMALCSIAVASWSPPNSFRRKSGAHGTLQRMLSIQKPSLACVVAGAILVAGCGSSSNSSTDAVHSTSSAPSNSGPGALADDAGSAATGDIPDNQVFLVYKNTAGGYSIKYPEGWTQSGQSHDVTFRDKNNLVHVLIAAGGAPTTASLTTQLNAL